MLIFINIARLLKEDYYHGFQMTKQNKYSLTNGISMTTTF